MCLAWICRWSYWIFTSNVHRQVLEELTPLLMFPDKVSEADRSEPGLSKKGQTDHPHQWKEIFKYILEVGVKRRKIGECYLTDSRERENFGKGAVVTSAKCYHSPSKMGAGRLEHASPRPANNFWTRPRVPPSQCPYLLPKRRRQGAFLCRE